MLKCYLFQDETSFIQSIIINDFLIKTVPPKEINIIIIIIKSAGYKVSSVRPYVQPAKPY